MKRRASIFESGKQMTHENMELVKKTMEQDIQQKIITSAPKNSGNPEILGYMKPALSFSEIQQSLNVLYKPFWLNRVAEIADVVSNLKHFFNIDKKHYAFKGEIDLNPNRFKKYFTSEAEKADFLKKLKNELDELPTTIRGKIIKEYSDNIACHNSEIRNLEAKINKYGAQITALQSELEQLNKNHLYTLQQSSGRRDTIFIKQDSHLLSSTYSNQIKEHTTLQAHTKTSVSTIKSSIEEYNCLINNIKKGITHLKTLIVQKEDILDNAIGLRDLANDKLDITKDIREIILDASLPLYQIVKSLDYNVTANIPKERLLFNNDFVNLLIMDDFIKNDDAKESAFGHPKLEGKINQNYNNKLQANPHACAIAGIIADIIPDTIFCVDSIYNALVTCQIPKRAVVNLSFGERAPKKQDAMFNLINNNKGSGIFIKALGNNSSISPEEILINKIKHSGLTNIIFVTNVMPDGKTISPSSSIPGNDQTLQELTVAAPGTYIVSTVPISAVAKEHPRDQYPELTDKQYSAMLEENSYKARTGTSVAAPVVTALAGLLMSNFPKLPVDKIVKCIKDSCNPTNEPNLFGHGVVNFENAIKRAKDMQRELNAGHLIPSNILGAEMALQGNIGYEANFISEYNF